MSNTITTPMQRAAKIAHGIVHCPESDAQMKLSLLQDLIIELLPGTDSVRYRRMMTICHHTQSEDVVGWLVPLLTEYLNTPSVANTLNNIKVCPRPHGIPSGVMM
jgi:hypothetical protein